MNGVVENFGAFLAMLPAAVLSFRPQTRGPDALFYGVLALAVLGPALWLAAQAGGPWNTGFAMSLWVTIVATLALFLGLSLVTRHAWRLAPLLLPYLVLLGIAALIWRGAPEQPVPGALPQAWFDAHIVSALAAYGLLTLAAVAGLAVFFQERALKAKHPTALTRLLPPIAESEALELRLLAAAEAVLALGVVSGMAMEYFLAGKVLAFDHKTLLSLAAFVVIGAILIARKSRGIRGRRVSHLALLACVLVTLAYPGVKFVTDVLIG